MSMDSDRRLEKRLPTALWLSNALWLYALLLLALNLLAWVAYSAAGHPPLRRPLFDLHDRYSDLTTYAGKISHLDRGAGPLAQGSPIYNYPAPAAYVYAFFLRGFPHHPVRAYLLLLLAGLACGVLLLWRAARGPTSTTLPLIAAAVATALLGSPLVFAADRGNLEGAVGLILAAGLVLFVSRRYYASAAFIGLAASVKPFPGLFLLLLLRRRLYPQAAVGIAIAALSVLLALTALGPTPVAAYKYLQPGVTDYFNNYVMKVPVAQEGRFDHSIMDFVKSGVNIASSYTPRSTGQPNNPESMFLPQDLYDITPAGRTPRKANSDQLRRMHTLFIAAMLLSAAGLGYTLLAIRKLPLLNQMILIATAITLFPPLAAEYTLVHLYVPFALFLLFLITDVSTGSIAFTRARVLGFLLLFALLFSPLSFFAARTGNIKTVLLVTLLFATGSNPMPSSIFRELSTKPEMS